jgi:hypothetical protein
MAQGHSRHVSCSIRTALWRLIDDSVSGLRVVQNSQYGTLRSLKEENQACQVLAFQKEGDTFGKYIHSYFCSMQTG